MTGLFVVAIFVELIFILWCFRQILLLVYEMRSNPSFLLLHRNVKEVEVAIGEPFLLIFASLLRKLNEAANSRRL